MKFRNFGQKSLAEIEQVFTERGFIWNGSEQTGIQI